MADQPRPAQNNRERIRIGAAIVLLVLLIAFVMKNTREVKVSFVFFDHETRMIYVLIVTALVGVVLDRLWQRHRHH
jgi:uncharacterized integral membrane protein